jgi:hypothetical protein
MVGISISSRIEGSYRHLFVQVIQIPTRCQVWMNGCPYYALRTPMNSHRFNNLPLNRYLFLRRIRSATLFFIRLVAVMDFLIPTSCPVNMKRNLTQGRGRGSKSKTQDAPAPCVRNPVTYYGQNPVFYIWFYGIDLMLYVVFCPT